MNVKSIDLEDGDDNRIARVTVSMSLTEVVYLAKITGARSWAQCDEVMPGGGDTSARVYDCLTGSVLNRYYDDGVADALRDLARGDVS